MPRGLLFLCLVCDKLDACEAKREIATAPIPLPRNDWNGGFPSCCPPRFCLLSRPIPLSFLPRRFASFTLLSFPRLWPVFLCIFCICVSAFFIFSRLCGLPALILGSQASCLSIRRTFSLVSCAIHYVCRAFQFCSPAVCCSLRFLLPSCFFFSLSAPLFFLTSLVSSCSFCRAPIYYLRSSVFLLLCSFSFSSFRPSSFLCHSPSWGGDGGDGGKSGAVLVRREGFVTRAAGGSARISPRGTPLADLRQGGSACGERTADT